MRTDQRPKKLFPSGTPPDYVLAAQSIARHLAGPSQEGDLYRQASKQVSVPIPLELLAQTEVLARRLGKSRGAMLAHLSSLGAQIVLDQLPAQAFEEVALECKERYEELFAEFSPGEGS